MKRIGVITSTRAEYGLLSPIIRELRKNENDRLRIELIVTGTHLDPEYGMTVTEIRKEKNRIDHEIKVSTKSDSAVDISDNQAEVLKAFTRLFDKQKFNAILLLGDRYETLAEAIAASNTKTPIFHISGGDISEGAIDDCIRHSITKMSYLHFTTNEESRRRVIQLGENPARVFNYGSTSIDNIHSLADMKKKEALDSLGLSECNYAICTYHPATIDNGEIDEQVSELLNAIKVFENIRFIFTKSNADQGGARINKLLDDAEKTISNLHVYTSLGVRRYLSLMKHAEFVLGNSSSGIVEAPSFHVPTVNIGDRQRGRLRTASIIDCSTDYKSITEAIRKALSDEMKDICKTVISPYGEGNSAEKIAKKTIEVACSDIDLKKRFYDMKTE